jgi:pimeloyl-ACP methyl ester carboxylesterase
MPIALDDMSQSFSSHGRPGPPPFILPPERISSSSRRRPDSSEERRYNRKDIKPTSDDLISNLLDSFSSIAVTADAVAPSGLTPYDFSPRYSLTSASNPPLSITTTKSSRRSSFSLPFRDGIRPAFASRPLYANAFVQPRHDEAHSLEEENDDDVEEDDNTAQPPVVAMSRSASARAKGSQQSFRKRQKLQYGLPQSQQASSNNSRPPSRGDELEQADQLGPLKGRHTQNDRVASRSTSMDSGYSNTRSVAIERKDKGKQPVYQVTVNTNARGIADDSRRNGIIFSGNGPIAPPRITSLSGRSSMSAESDSQQKAQAGRSASLNLASLQALTRDSGRSSSLNVAYAPAPSRRSQQGTALRNVQTIDERDPLQRVDSLTLLRRRPDKITEDHDVEREARYAQRGDRTPTQNDFEPMYPEETDEYIEEAESVAESPTVTTAESDSIAGLDDRSKELMRKIKELRAASQARLGSLDAARMKSAAHSRQVSNEELDFVPPLITSPPETSLANGQLGQAQRIHEFVFSDDSSQYSRPGLSSNASNSSLSSIRTATKYDTQVPQRFGSIGMISTSSSSRAPSIDARQRLDEAPTQPSKRISRWSMQLGGSRPGTANGHGPSATRTDSLRMQQVVNMPMIVAIPSPPASESNPDSIEEEIAAFVKSPRLSQSIRVDNDTRRVVFSEIGDPRGHVVMCCIGMGMTRYITAFYDELASSLGLRLITPDRPGIGDSDPYVGASRRPVDWPSKISSSHMLTRSEADTSLADVAAICAHLQISSFSILAHSAGAIYALATLMRMPSYVRGRIHLLAPAIPPSQMALLSSFAPRNTNVGIVPRSQRFLRMIPTPILRFSTSQWAINAGGGFRKKSQSSDSSNASPKGKNNANRSRRNSILTNSTAASSRVSTDTTRAYHVSPRVSTSVESTGWPALNGKSGTTIIPPTEATESPTIPHLPRNHNVIAAARARQAAYDAALTPLLFSLATRNANPSVDLLVVLEKERTIGFRYADVDAAVCGGVVIHHGDRDERVPLENVRWLARSMNLCEVRVLEGEGHGLMARAGVMGGVLTEMGRELELLGTRRT